MDHKTGTSAASDVRLVATIAAAEHLRHVRIVGSDCYQPYPTNVLGDNGIWLGVLAVFPAAAPVVPSFANAATWRPGFWGRAVIDSVESMTFALSSTIPGIRYNWHIDFDYAPEGGGSAGGLYVGYQQMYVDANHVTPVVGYTTRAWGITN